MLTNENKPITFHIFVDFDLHEEFKQVAKGNGYHTTAGKPQGKPLLSDLKKDITEAAMLDYINQNKGRTK